MLGHLGINVPDLASTKSYSTKLVPFGGFTSFFAADDEIIRACRQKAGYVSLPVFRHGRRGVRQGGDGPRHLAFMVRTRTAVHMVHEHVLARGGRVLHPPQEFPHYPPPYFATYWLDPFGFMLEAVCHHDAD